MAAQAEALAILIQDAVQIITQAHATVQVELQAQLTLIRLQQFLVAEIIAAHLLTHHLLTLKLLLALHKMK